MKRVLFFAILSFIFHFSSSNLAQAQGRFDACASFGANFSQIDGDGAGSYSHLGLRGGVGTSFYLGRDEGSAWRMVVELAFTQKGSNINSEMLERTIALNYVELPLMMSYTMMDGTLRLAAGVAPAVLVGATVVDGAGEENVAQENNYKRFDWCPLTLSARYLFSYSIAAEVRFQTSMLSVVDQAASGTYRLFRDNRGAFNRTVTIGLVYCF
ncbi:MAG: PorT family protein [Bacteroidales bacterium]|nr:PorT family protein [Bacteroidales bacterium]